MKIILNDQNTGEKVIPVPNFIVFKQINKYLSKKGTAPIGSDDIDRIKSALKKFSSLNDEFVLVDVCDKDGSCVKIIL